MAIQVTRTYVGSIQNQQQVCDGLDSLGTSASKIWNVARWTADRVWDATGEVPDEGPLKSYMKNQACWKDLNAQSSQKVIEELSDAFQSWFDLRQKDDRANPPGYRKHGGSRPRSTITFKEDGFKHDPKNNRVRLSKGANLKENWSDFILCEYQTRPDFDLSKVERVQQVRAVWNGELWELHFVCKVEIEAADSAGDGVAGIDLGIKNIATVAFPDEYVLYPGNSLKQDKHYFKRAEYDTEGDNGPSEKSMWARGKLADRETHFYHTLTDTIITECVKRGVGTLAVSWPEDVRESDWGKTGNKKLHTWAFDRIYQYLAYKGEEHGVEVLKENEWNTSKTCCNCGDTTDSNRVERGLYVCSSCGLVGNADCNGAENMRQKITPSPHGEDRSNGCVAQPSAHLFDRESGTFQTREQAVS
jgi:transposase, IS605 OrfB family, central region